MEALAASLDLGRYLCMRHADLASLQDPKQLPVVVDESLISGAVKRRENGGRAARACPTCPCPSCVWVSCLGGNGGGGGKGSAWWQQASHVAAGHQGQPAAEQLAEAAAAAERRRRWLPGNRGAPCCSPSPPPV